MLHSQKAKANREESEAVGSVTEQPEIGLISPGQAPPDGSGTPSRENKENGLLKSCRCVHVHAFLLERRVKVVNKKQINKCDFKQNEKYVQKITITKAFLKKNYLLYWCMCFPSAVGDFGK